MLVSKTVSTDLKELSNFIDDYVFKETLCDKLDLKTKEIEVKVSDTGIKYLSYR